MEAGVCHGVGYSNACAGVACLPSLRVRQDPEPAPYNDEKEIACQAGDLQCHTG